MGNPKIYFTNMLSALLFGIDADRDEMGAIRWVAETDTKLMMEEVNKRRGAIPEKKFYFEAGRAAETIISEVANGSACDPMNACAAGFSEFEDFIGMEEQEPSTDQFGNNTNFPNDVLSGMTAKGLIGKWTETIVRDLRYCLEKFHLSSNKGTIEDFRYIKREFSRTKEEIDLLTKVLEDLMAKEIKGTKEILDAIFGEDSNEGYLWEIFQKLYGNMEDWKIKELWTDCQGDERLFHILTNAEPEDPIFPISSIYYGF